MASILDFTINYMSDDEQKNQKCLFRPKGIQNKKIKQFRATNKKRSLITFDNHFVSSS